MSTAKDGSVVKVHYTGKLDDGSVFDSSKDREPLEFTLGQGSVIPGFEKGIVGMEVGSAKTIKLTPEEAYGPRRDNLIADVKKEQFPDNIEPKIGEQLQLTQQDGQVINVTVTQIEGDTVTLDANHPLAGKDLEFEVELVEVK
ncbi:MAG: peptidylprolyl isomerase [candidate division Zixibacteria bacterium]|nr:peptidylprolyl isomerase [candidate division Zixibacteria bacterium]